MNARLIAISGTGGKEPAAFVIEAQGKRLLLDCGEGPEPGLLPDLEAIDRVDAVVASAQRLPISPSVDRCCVLCRAMDADQR